MWQLNAGFDHVEDSISNLHCNVSEKIARFDCADDSFFV